MKTKTGEELTPEKLEYELDHMILECRKGIEKPTRETPTEQALLGAIWCLSAIRESYFGPAENHKNN